MLPAVLAHPPPTVAIALARSTMLIPASLEIVPVLLLLLPTAPLFALLPPSALIASLNLDVVFAIQDLTPSARAMPLAVLAPGITPRRSALPSLNAKVVLTVPPALASKDAVGATPTAKAELALSRPIAVPLELGTQCAQFPCAPPPLTAPLAVPPTLVRPLGPSAFGAKAILLPLAKIPISASKARSLTALSLTLAFHSPAVTLARPLLLAVNGAKVLPPRRVSAILAIAPARLLM